MFISKTMLDLISERLYNLEKETGYLKGRVRELEEAHDMIFIGSSSPSFIHPFYAPYSPLPPSKCEHKPVTCQTDSIPDLAFEELARLIVDGTPIKRKETVEVEVEHCLDD